MSLTPSNYDWLTDDARPVSTVSFEQVVLEKIKLAATARLSKQMLTGISAERIDLLADEIAQSFTAALTSTVWSDPSQKHTKTFTVTTEPVFKSWKHHLLASLPPSSARRRFLALLWDLSDADVKPLQYEHEIRVEVPAVLPEMQRQFPPDMGRLHFPITIHDSRVQL